MTTPYKMYILPAYATINLQELPTFTNNVIWEYYDGPLMGTWDGSDGQRYLYAFTDSERELTKTGWICLSRWIVCTLTGDQEELMRTKHLSFYDFILDHAQIWLMEIDATRIFPGVLIQRCFLVDPTTLPDLYLPEKDAYLSCEPFFADESVATCCGRTQCPVVKE